MQSHAFVLAQFTYFQQAGGRPLGVPAVEITYGLERILMALQVCSFDSVLPCINFLVLAWHPERTVAGGICLC